MNTVIGNPSGAVLVTMVERKSRLTFILKVLGKSAQEVNAAMITALHPHRGSVQTRCTSGLIPPIYISRILRLS